MKIWATENTRVFFQSIWTGIILTVAGSLATSCKYQLMNPISRTALPEDDAVVDTEPALAQIAYVDASNTNGTYLVDEQLSIQVHFDEAVTVTGVPRLRLATNRDALYTGGTGTSTLTFTYAVQIGDSASDLNYLSTTSLTIAGASIKDSDGADAYLELPVLAGANSLAGRKNLALDAVEQTDTFLIGAPALACYDPAVCDHPIWASVMTTVFVLGENGKPELNTRVASSFTWVNDRTISIDMTSEFGSFGDELKLGIGRLHDLFISATPITWRENDVGELIRRMTITGDDNTVGIEFDRVITPDEAYGILAMPMTGLLSLDNAGDLDGDGILTNYPISFNHYKITSFSVNDKMLLERNENVVDSGNSYIYTYPSVEVHSVTNASLVASFTSGQSYLIIGKREDSVTDNFDFVGNNGARVQEIKEHYIYLARSSSLVLDTPEKRIAFLAYARIQSDDVCGSDGNELTESLSFSVLTADSPLEYARLSDSNPSTNYGTDISQLDGLTIEVLTTDELQQAVESSVDAVETASGNVTINVSTVAADQLPDTLATMKSGGSLPDALLIRVSEAALHMGNFASFLRSLSYFPVLGNVDATYDGFIADILPTGDGDIVRYGDAWSYLMHEGYANLAGTCQVAQAIVHQDHETAFSRSKLKFRPQDAARFEDTAFTF